MIAEPTLGIDLPLKALAWEDRDGKVWLSYNARNIWKAFCDGPQGYQWDQPR